MAGNRGVAQSHPPRLGRLPRSVYLGKDVRHSSRQIIRILKRLGHQFVAHDEEAQFYFSREAIVRREFIPKSSKLQNTLWPGDPTTP